MNESMNKFTHVLHTNQIARSLSQPSAIHKPLSHLLFVRARIRILCGKSRNMRTS